jgi:hypothetical protein
MFKSWISLVLVWFALTGCSTERGVSLMEVQQPTPQTEAKLTRIPTDRPEFQPTPSPSPSPTLPAWATPEGFDDLKGISAEPVATAVLILPEGWSPDGQAFASWTFTESQSPIDYSYPPGWLNFHYVDSGQTCAFPYLLSYSPREYQVYWHEGERVLILGERSIMSGSPCQGDFSLTQETVQPVFRHPVDRPSPDGRYLAQTKFFFPEDPTLARTSIIAANTSQVVREVEWKFVETKGLGLADHWVTDEKFLITVTLDQGPLLIDVDQGVTQVAPELFKRLADAACGFTVDFCETRLRATGSMSAETGRYHIALYGWGMEANYPPVELYHAESGETESLPTNYFHSFSPDGGWMYVFNETFDSQRRVPIRMVGLKPVDPPGSLGYFPMIADLGAFDDPWSPDSQRMAIKTRRGVYIFSLPDVNLIGLWQLGRYESIDAYWSPNSRRLAVTGSIPVPHGTNALFILDVR